MNETKARAQIRARIYYKRYRDLYHFLCAEKDPKKIIEAVRTMIDVHAKWTSRECIRVLLDDMEIQEAQQRGELPLLIGQPFRHPTSPAYLEQVIKKGR